MFVLAFVHLLLIAGLLHRAMTPNVTQWEIDAMFVGLVALWPIFATEAVWGVWRRNRARPRGPVVLRAALVILFPSWRMALTDPRTDLMWVPRIGWQKPGKELFKRLDHAFSGPMLLFAFLILPVLVLDHVSSGTVHHTPALALALDIGIAVIWVAFATEFVFKVSAHPKPFAFVKERWLDVAIVVLPMLEFLTRWADVAPLARLLRLGRALSPEQFARMQRLYRLQGLATKAWHAILLFGGVSRLLGFTPEKRLAQLEERIADLEEQLKEACEEAEELRLLIAARETKEMKETEGQKVIATQPVDPPAPVA
jgi:voltage-gated potassium channel